MVVSDSSVYSGSCQELYKKKPLISIIRTRCHCGKTIMKKNISDEESMSALSIRDSIVEGLQAFEPIKRTTAMCEDCSKDKINGTISCDDNIWPPGEISVDQLDFPPRPKLTKLDCTTIEPREDNNIEHEASTPTAQNKSCNQFVEDSQRMATPQFKTISQPRQLVGMSDDVLFSLSDDENNCSMMLLAVIDINGSVEDASSTDSSKYFYDDERDLPDLQEVTSGELSSPEPANSAVMEVGRSAKSRDSEDGPADEAQLEVAPESHTIESLTNGILVGSDAEAGGVAESPENTACKAKENQTDAQTIGSTACPTDEVGATVYDGNAEPQGTENTLAQMSVGTTVYDSNAEPQGAKDTLEHISPDEGSTQTTGSTACPTDEVGATVCDGNAEPEGAEETLAQILVRATVFLVGATLCDSNAEPQVAEDTLEQIAPYEGSAQTTGSTACPTDEVGATVCDGNAAPQGAEDTLAQISPDEAGSSTEGSSLERNNLGRGLSVHTTVPLCRTLEVPRLLVPVITESLTKGAPDTPSSPSSPLHDKARAWSILTDEEFDNNDSDEARDDQAAVEAYIGCAESTSACENSLQEEEPLAIDQDGARAPVPQQKLPKDEVSISALIETIPATTERQAFETIPATTEKQAFENQIMNDDQWDQCLLNPFALNQIMNDDQWDQCLLNPFAFLCAE